jgi:hypothetical protein
MTPPAMNGGSTTLSVTACRWLAVMLKSTTYQVSCLFNFIHAIKYVSPLACARSAATGHYVRGRGHAGSFGPRTDADAARCTLVQVVQTNATRLHSQSGPSAALEIDSG